ncbi:MAG: photosynthetic reaction center cytochrome c subunit [Acidobacteria bacterium]|nr:photosynthetic reaction center cytochrome c subunit [Acidobacteriota bacterium]
MKLTRIVLASLSLVALTLPAALTSALAGQEPEQEFENNQVLHGDVLIDEMLEALRGLGLPRRAGRGCLHCHVGDMEQPRDTWDYASDAKENKQKARTMFAMVKEINERYLPEVAGDGADHQPVTCYTCHAGRPNPTPLPQVLQSEFELGGVERLAETYREARRRYFAADAYDFRVDTLIDVANGLTARGDFASAAAIHELNLEYNNDEPEAHRGLIRARMFEALMTGGMDAMAARYEQSKSEHPAEAFAPSLLDTIGWVLVRGGNEAVGVALFELNLAEHPDSFFPHESLAWGYLQIGEAERGIELAERWLEANPAHELGETLLNDLRESR